MAPTRSRKKPTTPLRNRILNAALGLYSTKGYFSTSIHDIQRAAGVAMGSIYNHFSGKEAIARALYDDLLGQMGAMVDEVTSRHEGSHAQGRAMVAALFELTESQPQTISYILNARHREFLIDVPGICSSRPFEKMRDIIIDGMKRGEIREMDPWLAASLAFGPALRMISLRLDGMISDPLPDATGELWDMTWAGIRAD